MASDQPARRGPRWSTMIGWNRDTRPVRSYGTLAEQCREGISPVGLDASPRTLRGSPGLQNSQQTSTVSLLKDSFGGDDDSSPKAPLSADVRSKLAEIKSLPFSFSPHPGPQGSLLGRGDKRLGIGENRPGSGSSRSGSGVDRLLSFGKHLEPRGNQLQPLGNRFGSGDDEGRAAGRSDNQNLRVSAGKPPGSGSYRQGSERNRVMTRENGTEDNWPGSGDDKSFNHPKDVINRRGIENYRRSSRSNSPEGLHTRPGARGSQHDRCVVNGHSESNYQTVAAHIQSSDQAGSAYLPADQLQIDASQNQADSLSENEYEHPETEEDGFLTDDGWPETTQAQPSTEYDGSHNRPASSSRLPKSGERLPPIGDRQPAPRSMQYGGKSRCGDTWQTTGDTYQASEGSMSGSRPRTGDTTQSGDMDPNERLCMPELVSTYSPAKPGSNMSGSRTRAGKSPQWADGEQPLCRENLPDSELNQTHNRPASGPARPESGDIRPGSEDSQSTSGSRQGQDFACGDPTGSNESFHSGSSKSPIHTPDMMPERLQPSRERLPDIGPQNRQPQTPDTLSNQGLVALNTQNNNLEFELRTIRLGFNPPIMFANRSVPAPKQPRIPKSKLGIAPLKEKSAKQLAEEEHMKKLREKWVRCKPPLNQLPADTTPYEELSKTTYWQLTHLTNFCMCPQYPVKLETSTQAVHSDLVHLCRHPTVDEYRLIKDAYGAWAEQNLIREKLLKQIGNIGKKAE